MDRVQHCEQFLMFFPPSANLHSLRLGVWEAQHYWHGVLLCKASSFVCFPENDTVGPVLIQIDVLCSRFVNATELGKNTLIFSEFAWRIIATPILQPIWKRCGTRAADCPNHGCFDPCCCKDICIMCCRMCNYQIIATWQRSTTCPLMTVSQCREPHQIEHHFRIVIVKHLDIS